MIYVVELMSSVISVAHLLTWPVVLAISEVLENNIRMPNSKCFLVLLIDISHVVVVRQQH